MSDDDGLLPPSMARGTPIPPFFFVHHPQHERDGVKLAGILITSFDQRKNGPTPQELETIERVQALLLADHLAGRLPVGDVSTLWINADSGRQTAAERHDEAWLRRRMADYFAVNLRVR
jgi:hypothetical protein